MKVPYLLWAATVAYCITMYIALGNLPDTIAATAALVLFMCWIQWKFYREWRAICIFQARLSPLDRYSDQTASNLDHPPQR